MVNGATTRIKAVTNVFNDIAFKATFKSCKRLK